ncbi:MAG: glycosyltransferase family 2 protein [Deltaproteobacteria bacterium]|nr:glycosyltransferase family 2 protein [Myxococcales bacterium]MDP3217093.1 glycosyltransferase family 2 protein [Deltaproteobacteria bacterium]
MLIVSSLVLLVWCIQFALALRVRRSVPALSDLAPAPAARAAWPRISLIVPARDEGLHIAGALASKLACGYPSLEVVAIDDRSTDDTGAIIDRAAASDPRVAAVHVTELPDGWLGKVHAMARGLERATGEWVLFSDADVHVEPGALERVVAWADAGGVDLVAVFPRMHPVGLLIDASVVAMIRVLTLSGRAWRANDDASEIGMSVGAFTLVRRAALVESDAIGHLRMEVADDVALGAYLKQQCGARCRILAGRADVHLVFMESLGAIARSADKGGGMLGFSWWRTVIFAALPTALDVGVPVAAIASGGAAAVVGAAILAVATVTHVVLARHFDGPLRGALLWPLGEAFMGALTLRAGLRAWKDQGIYWRRTFYPRAVIDAGRRLDMVALRVRPKEPAAKVG